MTAAYFLQLMGHQTVVFEEKEQPGGMLRYGIPSYRFPRERLQEDIDAILSTGVDLRCNIEIGKDITYDELKQEYDAVYIAIGAHTDKKFEVEGADSKGVISAVDMLRDIGYGKYPDFRGKKSCCSRRRKCGDGLCQNRNALPCRKSQHCISQTAKRYDSVRSRNRRSHRRRN